MVARTLPIGAVRVGSWRPRLGSSGVENGRSEQRQHDLVVPHERVALAGRAGGRPQDDVGLRAVCADEVQGLVNVVFTPRQ